MQPHWVKRFHSRARPILVNGCRLMTLREHSDSEHDSLKWAETGLQDSKWKFQNMVHAEQEYLQRAPLPTYGVPSIKLKSK